VAKLGSCWILGLGRQISGEDVERGSAVEAEDDPLQPRPPSTWISYPQNAASREESDPVHEMINCIQIGLGVQRGQCLLGFSNLMVYLPR